jgi:diaminohydroxyphosphoribosylaminopyrimidine deaminase/5-amino-6-(5-phosphoribosylamino)uracil reductase
LPALVCRLILEVVLSLDVRFANPEEAMRRAIAVAGRGIGFVEPNPPVGAVVVDGQLRMLGEGWHERFGGPHAEVTALARAGEGARGATLYVTLEPCCHHGKTPPCVEAVIAAGIKKVVVGVQDPFPQVAGKGLQRLRAANIEVEVGLLEPAVRRLTDPFRKLVESGRPWVHAKWAMTLDGRIAAHTGESKWISTAASRAVVHQLRGRMDAIVVGIETVLADDPLLTARPPGPRVGTRVVFDSRARLPLDSQLVRTAGEAPVLVITGPQAPREKIERLRDKGAEIVEGEAAPSPAGNPRPDVGKVLLELGRRRMTNVLVEGGSELLGAFFDRQLIDEVHVFVAPKLLGGADAKAPLAGAGRPAPPNLPDLESPTIEIFEGDVYIHGRLRS